MQLLCLQSFLDLIYGHRTLVVNQAAESDKDIHIGGPPVDPSFHRNDEQVYLKLEPGSTNLRPLGLKYLRISSKATVTHLRKYIAQKILNDVSKFNEVTCLISLI